MQAKEAMCSPDRQGCPRSRICAQNLRYVPRSWAPLPVWAAHRFFGLHQASPCVQMCGDNRASLYHHTQALTWCEQYSRSMPPSVTLLPMRWCPKQPKMSLKGALEVGSTVLAAGCPNSKSNTTTCRQLSCAVSTFTTSGWQPGAQPCLKIHQLQQCSWLQLPAA